MLIRYLRNLQDIGSLPILTKFDKRISNLKTRIKPSISNPILKQIDAISCLEVHQRKSLFWILIKYPAMLLLYVICKRCYVEVLLNKISIIEHGNNTYCKIKKSNDVIIDENPKPTKPLAFKITQKRKKIPIFYWAPKIHKNPTGARFISASKICSMCFSSYTLKLNVFIKMLNCYQIITTFGSYKISTQSFYR